MGIDSPIDNLQCKSVIRYYVFQKKIKSYLTNEVKNRADKSDTKIGYIVNPDLIKKWKKATDYEKISEYCDKLKINSYNKINDMQIQLIKQYIESNYYNSFNIFNYNNSSFLIKDDDYGYIFNKAISNDYWEVFLNEKTYEKFNLGPKNTIEKIKYIFKQKMAIFFSYKNNIIKMIIIKNSKPYILTFIFYYNDVYEACYTYFKEKNSNQISQFLENKRVFSMEKY